MRRWLRPDPDAPIETETFGASEVGWVRRTDLGPDVWELPDGTLRQERHKGEPVIVRLKDAWGRV